MTLLQSGITKSLAAAYTVDQSIYTGDAPDDEPKISRTLDQDSTSTGDWTYSWWYKKGPPVAADKTMFYITNSPKKLQLFLQADYPSTTVYNGGKFWLKLGSGSGEAGDPNYYSTISLRDYSAWYHFVLSVNGDDATMYKNGVSMFTNTDSNTYDPPDNGDLFRVACSDSNQLSNGYFADTHFIDGQALTASSFGETNSDTGQWVPTAYSGTYGNNGFFLDFQSGSLGTDRSGNGNDFTIKDSDSTRLVVRLDTPTNNFATLNPLVITQAVTGLTEGNLIGTGLTTSKRVLPATMGVGSGKWYWETVPVAGSSQNGPGLITGPSTGADGEIWDDGNLFWFYNGDIFMENVYIAGAPTFANDDILGLALDVDAKELGLYVNNVLGYTLSLLGKFLTAPSLSPANNLYEYSSTDAKFVYNFGQDSSFAGEKTAQGNQDSNGKGDFYYAPPTDYLALCTNNLPDPEIALPGKNFNTILYDDGAGAKTGVGFQPDLVWVKSRGSAYDHKLTDVGRGVTKALISNDASIESTDTTGLTVFGTDGFTVGADTDYSDTTGTGMVSWNWKGGGTAVSNTAGDDDTMGVMVSANTTAGFSIVTYTGKGNAATIGHGLGVVPEMIILKRYDAGGSGAGWYVYQKHMDASAPEDKYMQLQDTTAVADGTWTWNDTPPTSSVFSVGSDVNTTGDTNTFVAYCFASTEGYSKVGGYEGNGNADGSFIYTGFRPAFIMTKSVDSTSDWQMFDDKRIGYNVDNNELHANGGTVEVTTDFIDIVSNGFKNRTAGDPNIVDTFIYIAFAESPFKYSNAR